MNLTSNDIYVEEGVSAKNLKRPQMQKILKMIENEEIDVILICKLDRLSRSLSDIVGFIDLCLKHKVDLVSIKENIDMTTSMGRMFVYMMGVLAQFEREQISERTINGLKEKAKQGFYPHGNKVPYGYRKDINHKLIIIKDEVKVIKEALQLYAYDNKSEYDVSEHIKKKHNKYFSPKNLRVFLEKPIHKGIVEVGGEEFAVVEPIFSSDDLQALNQRKKLNIYSKKNISTAIVYILIIFLQTTKQQSKNLRLKLKSMFIIEVVEIESVK